MTCAQTLSRFLKLLMLATLSACTQKVEPNSQLAPVVFPVASAISGATLSGVLAGKSVWLLPSNMNPSGCWIDSQFWTGAELYFGISSIDWTALNNGTLTYNGACSPSPAFVPQSGPGVTGNFNIYRAVVTGSTWTLTSVVLNNSQTASVAALKSAASATATTAFVKYEKTSANGNIYVTQRTADNTYSTPVAFSQNSANCNDDNPMLSADGTQLIFASIRTVANGSTCSGSALKTFWSSVYSAGAWQLPTAVTLSPTPTASVDQAWLDAAGTTLYWTASGLDCTGPVTTCLRKATGGGTTFTSSAAQIATPLTFASWPTTVGTTFVSHIGQFTMNGSIAIAVCGVSSFVGSSATAGLTTLSSQSVYQAPNSPAPPYYYYHTDFRTCLMQ